MIKRSSNIDQATKGFSILEHLKDKTTKHHQLAEKKNLAKFIIDHSITTDQYKELLKKNYCIYAAIEKFLNTNKNLATSNLKPFISFDKSNALKKDLDSYSVDISATKQIKIKLPNNFGALVGALYVIEGSMLGGLLIAKHLKQCPQLNDSNTHYFFGGDPKDHLARWKNLCKNLENRSYTQEEVSASVDAASLVFESFY